MTTTATGPATAALVTLEPGQAVPYGGDRVTYVSAELAAAFRPGDRLIVVQDTGDLLHVPADVAAVVDAAITRAVEAFAVMATVSDEQVSRFFGAFADRLADDALFARIAEANATDVERARMAGRSTTRLELSSTMRAGMIGGLRGWAALALGRDAVESTIEHPGWRVEARRAPLGVVGFVFEGRPNVFADATGVLRTGNTVVFRIGSDALGTARSIVAHALQPALDDSGLPVGAVSLVDAVERSAGWALLGDRRLGLAVARGSGPAVAQLGAVARQAGVPASLHGTGGAWLVASVTASADRFAAAVRHSLDRKVCNTLNVCCIPRRRLDLVDVLLRAAADAAAERGTVARFHVERSSVPYVPAELFATEVDVLRADGIHRELQATPIEPEQLGCEWEWEGSPELSLVVVDDVMAAVELANRYSPHFIASLVGHDEAEHEAFYAAVDAPFVGDGFTRWVDGQYALNTPELGLSNWQSGRLLARGGVLSGDSVFTVRHRVRIADTGVHR
jgi:glutamate-5-semialdehyde dehydrogenase